jgi:UDP-glucuronate decarboxylase
MMATDPKITGAVNIGNPGELSMRELADLVVDLTGSKSNIVSRPLPPDDPKQRRPDITLAKEVLGWEPRVALREGLRKTIDYFDAFLSEELAEGRCTRLRVYALLSVW